MLVLIVGGSGSGKSAYAEECLLALSREEPRYYLATMQVFDSEGLAKIERHRKLRAGKGFITIEQPTEIGKALGKPEILRKKGEGAALLECMSNLVANEMFSEETPLPCGVVAERVVSGVKQLCAELKHLVIVTNNVFEDGVTYDETTMEYITALGMVNEQLAAMADRVTEVVVGIPLDVKGGEQHEGN